MAGLSIVCFFLPEMIDIYIYIYMYVCVFLLFRVSYGICLELFLGFAFFRGNFIRQVWALVIYGPY